MTDRPGGSRALVELRGIRKRFGEVQALRGVDFAVKPGEVRTLAAYKKDGRWFTDLCLIPRP